MRKAAGTLIGKSASRVVRMRGRSAGQALPGLIVETLVPGYLGVMLTQLPEGVVIVTGTNGKTTTTKMIVEVLQVNGKRVLTNATGSNLTRGIISSISQRATPGGRLPFDIAVFELDEAYAHQFTNAIKPRFVLALNASRDQLDRYGEVDTVAKLIGDAMLSATDRIVTNADDPRLLAIAQQANVPSDYFGVAVGLRKFFPRDDELVAVGSPKMYVKAPSDTLAVELASFKGSQATYRIGKQRIQTKLEVTGQHNFQNAAGALALLRVLLPKVQITQIVKQLSMVQPAFGRGEIFHLKDGSKLQLNLVKNPASFRQGIASYVRPNEAVMIAINDKLADSRDVSWLWDIDFTGLQMSHVAVTTGSRAADMALRLAYDETTVDIVKPHIDEALQEFAKLPGDKVIFASYTAMLRLYEILKTKAGKKL